MRRFRNILAIPANLNADDRALRRAADLADTNAARLTVAALLETDGSLEDLAPFRTEVIEGMQRQLDEATQPARDRGIVVRTKVLVGRPFLEIIRSVLADGHDLVMKTARGKRRFQPRLVGSTALHLLRKCPCPVWILDPKPAEHRGILAAVDPDTTDPEEQAVNVKIMELASSLAYLETAPLHVVHAWSVPFEDMIQHSPFLRVTKTQASNYIKDIEGRHRERFDALIEPFRQRNPGLSVHFVKGLPESVIVEMAEEHNVEVVVMATTARTGVQGLLIGDTAENVLGRIDRSVLTVKPDAFVSPIAA